MTGCGATTTTIRFVRDTNRALATGHGGAELPSGVSIPGPWVDETRRQTWTELFFPNVAMWQGLQAEFMGQLLDSICSRTSWFNLCARHSGVHAASRDRGCGLQSELWFAFAGLGELLLQPWWTHPPAVVTCSVDPLAVDLHCSMSCNATEGRAVGTAQQLFRQCPNYGFHDHLSLGCIPGTS